MAFSSGFTPLVPGSFPSLVTNLRGYDTYGLPFDRQGNGASGANYTYTVPRPMDKGDEFLSNPLDHPDTNSYVNDNMFIDQTKRIEFDTSVSQLTWFDTTNCRGDHGEYTLYHTLCWGALNAFLKSPEGRKKYGHHSDTIALTGDWRFIGQFS
jgi:hypothetical protein